MLRIYSKKTENEGNKLKKRAELEILVRYENTHIYRVYVLIRREKKIVRTSNIRFNERKGLITNRKKEEELISTNQNSLNKE